MNRVKKINIVFLITACIPFIASCFYIEDKVIALIVGQLLLLLPTIGYIVINKIKVKEAIRFHKVKFSNVLLLILFAYMIMPLITLINAITLLFTTNETAASLMEISTNHSFVISLLVIAFVPCVFEEIVYRGIFYNEYRKVNVRKGILLSAFLFGILHLNLNQFAYAFAMGIIFALVIEATDSIVSTMIIHFLINGSSVFMSHIMSADNLKKMADKVGAVEDVMRVQDTGIIDKGMILEQIQTMILPVILCSVIAFFLYRRIAMNANQYQHVKEIFRKQSVGEINEKKTSLISIPLLLGIGICIIIMASNFINSMH